MTPLVILTGFLGAGKTTVLNQLLATRRELGTAGRIGLVVNELGTIGVDGALLPPGASRQIELPGGCVCCVLSDDLGKTLLDLLEASPDLEAIVLETTGVAEPLPLAWALERPPVSERVRLAAIVTLVDAEAFLTSRHLSPAVDAQVINADVLLLTKEQVAAAQTAAATVATVQALAPRVEVRRGDAGAHARWLHQLLSDPELDLHQAPRHGANPKTSGHHHDHDQPGHDCDVDHDRDDDAGAPARHPASAAPSPEHLLESCGALLPDRVVDLEELEDHLAALPTGYVRIKGITRAIDGRRGDDEIGWYAFHRVGLRVSSEPLAHEAKPRVVALGRGIDIGAVMACIDSAVVTP